MLSWFFRKRDRAGAPAAKAPAAGVGARPTAARGGSAAANAVARPARPPARRPRRPPPWTGRAGCRRRRATMRPCWRWPRPRRCWTSRWRPCRAWPARPRCGRPNAGSATMTARSTGWPSSAWRRPWCSARRGPRRTRCSIAPWRCWTMPHRRSITWSNSTAPGSACPPRRWSPHRRPASPNSRAPGRDDPRARRSAAASSTLDCRAQQALLDGRRASRRQPGRARRANSRRRSRHWRRCGRRGPRIPPASSSTTRWRRRCRRRRRSRHACAGSRPRLRRRRAPQRPRPRRGTNCRRRPTAHWRGCSIFATSAGCVTTRRPWPRRSTNRRRSPTAPPRPARADVPDAAQRREIEAHLQQAEQALADGHLDALQHQLQAIDGVLGVAQAGRLPAGMRTRLQALRAEGARLKGWKQWGGERARDDLAAEAEALARHTQVADDATAIGAPRLNLHGHAASIQALRQRWKALDRQGAAASQAQWQRFDAALQRAFEPVAAQHAALEATRRENLAAREALLAPLEALALPSDSPAGPALGRRTGAGLEAGGARTGRFPGGVAQAGPGRTHRAGRGAPGVAAAHAGGRGPRRGAVARAAAGRRRRARAADRARAGAVDADRWTPARARVRAVVA